MGEYIPDDLETDAGLETILGKYFCGMRYGRFTITDFSVSDGLANIAFENIAMLSGGGAELIYSISGDGDTVEYVEAADWFRS